MSKRHEYCIMNCLILTWRKYGFLLIIGLITLAFSVYHRLDNISYYGLPKFFPCDPTPYENSMDRFSAVDRSTVDVPNIIHFLRFAEEEDCFTISKEEVQCLLTAIDVQKPDRILIHTDNVQAVANFIRNHEALSKHGNLITVMYRSKPQHAFGLSFNAQYAERHIRDISKLKILRKYGGIFMDNTVYLLRSLEEFLVYEMTVMAENDSSISNQVLIAHRDSRFLYKWIQTYHHYSDKIADHHDNPAMVSMVKEYSYVAHVLENVLCPTLIYYDSSKFTEAQASLQYYFMTLIKTEYLSSECP